ncbi:DNA-directed DNA polymerase [Tanacetum coccineum]
MAIDQNQGEDLHNKGKKARGHRISLSKASTPFKISIDLLINTYREGNCGNTGAYAKAVEVLILYQAYGNLYAMPGRKEDLLLLEDKQISSVRRDKEYREKVGREKEEERKSRERKRWEGNERLLFKAYLNKRVHYKEFEELIQPFEDPKQGSQLDRKLLKTMRLQETLMELSLEEFLCRPTEIKPRVNNETITYSVEADMPSIHYLTEMQEPSKKWLNTLKNSAIKHLGPHYTKDCPLKEEEKTLKEAYYTQFGGPFQGGGYRAAAPGFYQRNNANPSYQERRQSMEDTLSKFMSESAKRHEENSNLIKEIRASTDVAIRNQGASIKTLEIQIGQMSKELQERGFKSLPISTEANPRDQVKSISTTIEVDSYPIRRIGSFQYAVSTGQNRASVSVMPLSTYLNLGLGELAHTKLTVELADMTVKYPKGIAENVLVGIGKFVFPVDFIILYMPEDIKVPLILERPFLSTARAKIDVYKEHITLRTGEERSIFKSVKPASSLIKRVDMLSLKERMDLDLEARLLGETLVINRSLDPLNEDYIELNNLNEPFELRKNQSDDLMPTIEEGEVIEEFRTRDDGLDTGIDDYTSYCDYDKKIHID